MTNAPHLFNLYSRPDNLNQSQESKFLSLEHTPLEHTPLEHTPLEHIPLAPYDVTFGTISSLNTNYFQRQMGGGGGGGLYYC
jgi:hypothetical protein